VHWALLGLLEVSGGKVASSNPTQFIAVLSFVAIRPIVFSNEF